MNYTGQRKDDTGLLYYHARYYDPGIARFVSADSIVPGAASGVGGAGGMVGTEQNSRLTVDFHESGFLSSVAEENALTLERGFWFELSAGEKQKAGDPSGPASPQSLNRYAYTLNNPLRYIDPTGHRSIYMKVGSHAHNTFLANLATEAGKIKGRLAFLMGAMVKHCKGEKAVGACGVAVLLKLIAMSEDIDRANALLTQAASAAGPGGTVQIYINEDTGEVTYFGYDHTGKKVYEEKYRGRGGMSGEELWDFLYVPTYFQTLEDLGLDPNEVLGPYIGIWPSDRDT
ncbi:MAG TPA: RHS repeat-associated core domain-containing protein [Chloroflexia bacterium]